MLVGLLVTHCMFFEVASAANITTDQADPEVLSILTDLALLTLDMVFVYSRIFYFLAYYTVCNGTRPYWGLLL